MSDAICGPANPLQQFKQQTQLDRTLQQDRLTSRASPSQAFRTAQPNAGQLDPEFEAFQAGVPPAELPHLQPFQLPPQGYGGPPQAPSWASDFQRMNISSPSPLQQQSIPQSGPSTANWAQGFREQVVHTAPRAQTSASSPQQFQQMARFGGLNRFESSLAPINMPSNVQAKGKEPAVEQFDEAAFERAFDQARNDMIIDAGGESTATSFESAMEDQHQSSAEQQTLGMDDEAKRMASEDYQAQLRLLKLQMARSEGQVASHEQQGLEAEEMQAVSSSVERDLATTERTGLDLGDDAFVGLPSMQDPHQIRQAAEEEQAESQEQAKENDDALAATAHELLEKVHHNQTDKFRNSQFLALMRKLRDREVKVEGDKMVETNSATTTAAETQLKSTSAIPQFDNSEQRPAPLAPNTVDTRPYEYGIPHEEQDHDAGRQGINPQDGREVVDMLNQPGAVTNDIGTSTFQPAPTTDVDVEAPVNGKLRGRNDALSEMLYGEYGTVSLPPH